MGHQHSKLRKIQKKANKCRDVHALLKLLNDEGLGIDCLVNTDEYDGVTPLWLAVQHGDCKLAQLIIEAGADINLACCGLKMTPLHMATYNHNIDMVRLLVSAGADMDVMDKWNYTPLIYAANHHEPFTVNTLLQILIDGGCDINFGATLSDEEEDDEDEDGNLTPNKDVMSLNGQLDGDYITYVREPMGPISGTALHFAIQNPHLPNDTVKILLQAKADINKKNLHGQTPLMMAILDLYYDHHSQIQSHVQLLMSEGACVNACDNRGWSPCHYAAKRGSVTRLDILMSQGSDCTTISTGGETPLWLLLANGWYDGVKFLLKNGCDVNYPLLSTTIVNINENKNATLVRYGPTLPIEFAICNRCYDVAELMLRVGCKIDSSTWLGNKDFEQDTGFNKFNKFRVDFLKRKKSVIKLKELARFVIRKQLKQAISIKLNKVQLPRQLKDYICYVYV